MALAGISLLVIVYFALASEQVVAALRSFNDHRLHGGLLLALLLVPYLLVALPAARSDPAAFGWGLVRMLLYVFVPGLALLFRPSDAKALHPLDVLAVLALWFPIELDLLPGVEANVGGVGIPVALLTGIDLGFLLFLVIRPTERLGYSYRMSARAVGWSVAAFVAFAMVGVPLGMLMGFIKPELAAFDAGTWLARLLGITFLNALPEELLFRGIIQNLIEQRFGRGWITLIAAALIFGLSHINNTTDFHSPPNWPYVIMATLAGLAYGWAWRKSERITGSAITHTLVNFMWGIVFA